MSCCEFSRKKKLFHVRLRYNTNLSQTTCRGQDIMELWSRFENVEVNASLDAMGARGEYIRKGQKWAKVVENRERMSRVCPNVVFRLTPTISVMNLLHFPDFVEEWLNLGYIGPMDAPVNILLDPLEYRIQILPKALKEKAAAKYQGFSESLVRRYGRAAEHAISDIRGTLEFMWAQDLTSQLEAFRKRTKALDTSRNENFEQVFPEFGDFL